jgi:hemerythrin
MSLQWSEDLSVGYPLIDDQHRSLFDQFERFLVACDERRGPAHLRELFAFLDLYVILHFREEEELMERHDYPDVARHKAEHRYFIEQLAGLKEDLAATGPTIQVIIRTNKALIYWLTEHIREVDTGLAAHLQQND